LRVWRISNHADLTGRGGLLAEGRWHRRGIRVVYCSDHPATSMLEVLVHVDRSELPARFRLFGIDVPDDAPVAVVDAAELPSDWRSDSEATQGVGTALLTRAEHAGIRVPSALVPHAWNLLLNPRHADAARCAVGERVDGVFDARLFT
jgi:RES domain-containing protein